MAENKEQAKENKEETEGIEILPAGYTYAVMIDGEKVNIERMEDALVLNKLEKIDKQNQEILEKLKK